MADEVQFVQMVRVIIDQAREQAAWLAARAQNSANLGVYVNLITSLDTTNIQNFNAQNITEYSEASPANLNQLVDMVAPLNGNPNLKLRLLVKLSAIILAIDKVKHRVANLRIVAGVVADIDINYDDLNILFLDWSDL